MLGERQDVLRPRPQRREIELDHVQPVVQVLAEAAVREHRLEVLVRRREHAHVDPLVLGGTERSHLVLLQHAQELGLQRQRELADLVEEDRAVVRLHEQAVLVDPCIRERTLLVPEELALDEPLGHGREVHADERAVRARRVVVDRPRDELLAGAALAGDEDRCRRGRDPPHQGHHVAHRLALRDDRLDPVAILHLALQPRDLRPQRPLAERLVRDEQQLLDLERLGDVVVGSELHRADRRLDRTERRDHHEVRRLRQLHDAADQVEAVHLRHPQIGDHEVEAPHARELEPRRGPARRIDVVAGLLELLREQIAHGLVIFDDQDGRGALARHAASF